MGRTGASPVSSGVSPDDLQGGMVHHFVIAFGATFRWTRPPPKQPRRLSYPDSTASLRLSPKENHVRRSRSGSDGAALDLQMVTGWIDARDDVVPQIDRRDRPCVNDAVAGIGNGVVGHVKRAAAAIQVESALGDVIKDVA